MWGWGFPASLVTHAEVYPPSSRWGRACSLRVTFAFHGQASLALCALGGVLLARCADQTGVIYRQVVHHPWLGTTLVGTVAMVMVKAMAMAAPAAVAVAMAVVTSKAISIAMLMGRKEVRGEWAFTGVEPPRLKVWVCVNALAQNRKGVVWVMVMKMCAAAVILPTLPDAALLPLWVPVSCLLSFCVPVSVPTPTSLPVVVSLQVRA